MVFVSIQDAYLREFIHHGSCSVERLGRGAGKTGSIDSLCLKRDMRDYLLEAHVAGSPIPDQCKSQLRRVF